jgi:hypothetical protein
MNTLLTIETLTYERDYLRGQVDCLIGNEPASNGTAYLLGYADAYSGQEAKTAQTLACEAYEKWNEEGCF